eukprot:IDg17537t1
MQLAGAIRKQVVLRPKRTANGCARARCPDVKQLPKALWAPLQRLVRSRPPTPLLNDGRRRPLFDWDAWVRQHLTREYWDSKGTIRTSWPECVRAWAAMRVHDDFSLVATSDALVRSIVTVAVAETLAHQHGTPFDRLDLSVRRHINTAASRQRDDACAKVTMFHVVQLAFARSTMTSSCTASAGNRTALPYSRTKFMLHLASYTKRLPAAHSLPRFAKSSSRSPACCKPPYAAFYSCR